MKRVPLSKIVTILLVCYAIGTTTLLVTREHWWLRVAGSKVMDGSGRELPAGLFRSSNGDFLIVGDEIPGGSYLFSRSELAIGGSGIHRLGPIVFATSMPIPAVNANSAKVKPAPTWRFSEGLISINDGATLIEARWE
jgi:hypothetical protein